VARVRLNYGSGQVTVNGKTMQDYFPREVLIMRINSAFEAASALEKFDVVAKVHGGGPSGQADAVRHGIARALEKVDPAMRGPLKRNGFLTRDARKKERKKYGQKGARARFQFSKR
jgi:small subunit ribosomal protein S9